MRLSSVSSHDSGFISQDAFQSKSPSPMPPEAANQVRMPLTRRAAGTQGALATVEGVEPNPCLLWCFPKAKMLSVELEA